MNYEPNRIIGAGGWGTALGIAAARAGNSVRLWSRNPEALMRLIASTSTACISRRTKYRKPSAATTDTAEALAGARSSSWIAFACHARTSDADVDGSEAGDALRQRPRGSRMRLASASRKCWVTCCANVSRPLRLPVRAFFAQEVAAGRPTAIVAASVIRSIARCRWR